MKRDGITCGSFYLICILIILSYSSSEVFCEIIEVTNNKKIQDAIDAASLGDQILVHAGEYNESLLINKKVDLIGMVTGAEYPIIKPRDGYPCNAVTLLANGIKLNGFRIINQRHLGGACIYINSSNNSIIDVIIEGSLDRDRGIVLKDNTNNNIYDCVLNGVEFGAITILNSTSNIIHNNSISACHIGIQISSSKLNLIKYNKIQYCDYGIVYESIDDRIINKEEENDFYYNYIDSPYIGMAIA